MDFFTVLSGVSANDILKREQRSKTRPRYRIFPRMDRDCAFTLSSYCCALHPQLKRLFFKRWKKRNAQVVRHTVCSGGGGSSCALCSVPMGHICVWAAGLIAETAGQTGGGSDTGSGFCWITKGLSELGISSALLLPEPVSWHSRSKLRSRRHLHICENPQSQRRRWNLSCIH